MTRWLRVLWILSAVELARAGSTDRVVLAAMSLSDAPNYSWTCVVDDTARSYARRGKHLAEGYTWVTLPATEDLAKRLGSHPGTELAAIFRTADECVIMVNDQWKSLDELPPHRRDDSYATITPGRGWRNPAAFAGSSSMATPSIGALAPIIPEREGPDSFCNARFAPSAPHEELAIIISSWADVTVEQDVVRGSLSDVGAQLLLCPVSDKEIDPLTAAGEFTLWLKNDRVVRYRVKLEGVLRVKKKKVVVRQTSDTEVRDVGTTVFFVPHEARLKLGN